jgi:hypothetical protein
LNSFASEPISLCGVPCPEFVAMRTFLLLLAAVIVFIAGSLAYPAPVRGDNCYECGNGGGHHGGFFGHHHAGPKVKATGKHHHKLKPPKPPKPPKPVKQGGLFHFHK